MVVLGGHTVNDEEIKFGMAVTGLVHPDRIWRNVGARPGDVLVLTKALGTGILTTAAKHGGRAGIGSRRGGREHAGAECRRVSRAARLRGARLHRRHGLLAARATASRWRTAAACASCSTRTTLPLLPGAAALAQAGQLTGGCRRNRAWLGERVDVAANVPGRSRRDRLRPADVGRSAGGAAGRGGQTRRSPRCTRPGWRSPRSSDAVRGAPRTVPGSCCAA